jgi:CPA2 family monovalent cation:H+ antiporter-2
VDPASPTIGRTLADLNLRGLTGATVLAILRRGEQVAVPGAGERLQADDVLALAGSHDAIREAQRLIEGRRDRGSLGTVA